MIETLAALGVVLVLVLVAAAAAAAWMATSLLYICEPNEVLIFSGRTQTTEFGTRPYRAILGGRAWRVPLLERVDRLDMTNMIIDLSVSNAYSKGGIPLSVQGVANIKMAGMEPVLRNGVERLLGKRREEVMRIAKDVLEGNLRGVLSRLTPEEVNEDKLTFAAKLQEEADEDLAKLGLILDTMKIQNVHDERGYLDSIGRKLSAEIIKKSRVAEANAKATAIKRDAGNRQRARLTQIEAEQTISVAQAERRIGDALSRALAMVAEETGKVNAAIAKAEAALEAEEARVEQTRLRLEADVIAPAKAAMDAEIAAAKGRSSRILEEGRANAKVLDEMVKVWKSAGVNARDIFLMQKLRTLLGAMVETIGVVKVDRITMLPSGGDSGGDGDRIRGTVRFVEEIKGALGVDLPKLLEQYATKK